MNKKKWEPGWRLAMRLVVDANAMNNTYINVCYIEHIERPNENSIHQHNQINTNFNLKRFFLSTKQKNSQENN